MKTPPSTKLWSKGRPMAGERGGKLELTCRAAPQRWKMQQAVGRMLHLAWPREDYAVILVLGARKNPQRRRPVTARASAPCGALTEDYHVLDRVQVGPWVLGVDWLASLLRAAS